MTGSIVWKGTDIYIRSDVDSLREYHRKGLPVILVLSDENRELDTSFARFAVSLDETTEDVREDYLSNIESIVGSDFLDRVVARAVGVPMTICRTDRLVVRELAISDVADIVRIYEDADGKIESFFDDFEDAQEYLKGYIENVYDIYGCGIWGITSTDDLGCEIIGIAGLTARVSDTEGNSGVSLELGYALDNQHRGKGYAYEACSGIIQYADKNLEYDDIFVRVAKNNEPGLKLAQKLRADYKIRIV